ncbi:MAG: aminoacyl-tRNA hydrolase [Candidatus Omnitrophota bacterium]
MKFIFGIGNPGKKYANTRHNVGSRVIDLLKRAKSLPGVQLIEPEAYVNKSGEQLASAFQSAGGPIGPNDILVVCDDANLDFGKLRFRAAGSSGGHHGLESIIERLGSEEFPRLRIGIRTGKMPKDLASFVLGPFEPEEEGEVLKILEKAALICESWAKEGPGAAQDQLGKLQSVKEKGVKE